MTIELTMLALTLALALAQIIVAALAKRTQEPSGWAMGARDGTPPNYQGVTARLARAQSNLLETLPIFVGAVLICHLAGKEGSLSHWGAQLYFWARLAFVPIYALGLPYVRTLVWVVAFAGLCMILSACLMP